MATYWVDPDVAADPRHLELTPRLAPDSQGYGLGFAMPELLALLDPASPYLQQYRRWLAEAEARAAAKAGAKS